MAKPEKLNLWDRFFNRYRKEIIERGKERWYQYYSDSTFNEINNRVGQQVPNSRTIKEFVKYKIIDRLTGSETIKKEYLK